MSRETKKQFESIKEQSAELAKLQAQLEENFLLSEKALEQEPTKKIFEYIYKQLEQAPKETKQENQKDRQDLLAQKVFNATGFFDELLELTLPEQIDDEENLEAIKELLELSKGDKNYF